MDIESNMSDTTLLVTVEDLINRAMGPPDVNVVNFKLIQMVLHILARQQRILQQRVEIKVSELADLGKMVKKSTEFFPSKSSRLLVKRRVAHIKEEREKDGQAASFKEKEELKEKERDETYKLNKKEEAEEINQEEQEKAGKTAQKEQEKAKKIAHKEQGKSEKLAQEEEIEAEKAAVKEQETSRKVALKEVQEGQEKAEERDQLETEKAETQNNAEKEKKRFAKEQEKADKEMARAVEEEESQDERLGLKSPADEKEEQKEDVTYVTYYTSISAKETLRGKESVLVVEKGPTKRLDSRSRTNIDVVTQSQFSMLEEAVRQLKNVAIPKTLKMPDNEKLRSDLAKGTATLPDTMQAMQVEARLKAAEATIGYMTGLLTQLSAAGAADLSGKVETVVAEAAVAVEKQDQSQATRRESYAPKKMVLIDSKISEASPSVERPAVVSPLEGQPSAPLVSVDIPRPLQTNTPRTSKLLKTSIASTASTGPGVTKEEKDKALRDFGEEIFKKLQGLVSHAASTADHALYTARRIANKLDVALKLDARISSLFTIVGDYAQQLSGYDAGLTAQMQNFQDQIDQMRTDLQMGLAQLENINNNTETAETERYMELVDELKSTDIAHNSLQRLQEQLGDELRSLVECVEMLREQKCDRDELFDGLQGKADISHLAGLLSEANFAGARSDFERRLDLCHEKFRRQNAMWTTAIKDLTGLTDQKAELVQLLSLRDLTQKELQELRDRLRGLAFVLGEPKAALLTRKMSRGGLCGACRAAAQMEAQDVEARILPHLPPLHPPPTLKPCTRWIRAEQPLKRHACHRWVGGSHTLLRAGGRREIAGRTPAALELRRVHKHNGSGDDGRQYFMEKELLPCIQCNILSKREVPHSEGGDAH